MATLSLASDLAWRFAANEALTRGSDTIELTDLVLGILSIEKAFSPELAPTLGITEYGLATVRVEWQETLLAAATASARIAFLRRTIRDEVPQSPHKLAAETKLSRSAECKAVFNRAHELADVAGSTVVGIRYLLFAALERADKRLPQAVVDQLLRIKIAISPLAHRPLHTSLGKIEHGYISDVPFEPGADLSSGKR